MIRAARILVIASTVLAVAAEIFLGTPYAPQVFFLSIALFALMLAAGQRLRPIAMPLVLASLYLAPAVLNLWLDQFDYGLDVIWIAPVLGLILSGRSALDWSLPKRWQWPLITWAVLVAIAWPIVFLREVNFAPWILPLPRVSNSSIGFAPWQVDQSVAYFAIGHMLGILFIDALCRWYRDDVGRFRREVLAPLLAAAGIAALVAIYQGFVDLSFLNTGFWAYMIRASGTLADPNKLGGVAGLWTVGAVVYARRAGKPWNVAITIAGLVLGIAAAWLSGSRTGLASVFISLVIAAIESLRWLKLDLRKVAMAGGGAMVIGALMVLVLQNASTHTVGQRGTWGYLPLVGDRGIANSAHELLWDRNGYGPAAIQMIKEHPIDGVGVGAYYALAYDYGEAIGRIIRGTDNAQAWWRQNFAELGAFGSIPSLIWIFVFGRTMLFGRTSGDRASAGMLRGGLIAFFIASLFGVPSQSVAIALTFWVFVFWFTAEQGGEAAAAVSPGNGWPPLFVVAAAALIAIHAGMTLVHAFDDLRPQNRAQRFDWYYRYGYHTNEQDGTDLERDPGGNPVGRRWTMKDSLAVIPVKGKVLKFVAWIDHPDSAAKPLHTQVWADSHLVYEGDLRRDPLFLDIPATPGKTHMVIETSIDRTFNPSQAGNSRDNRDLGLSIRDWTWQ